MIAQTGKELPRGCGATTAQIVNALKNAVYVLPTSHVDRSIVERVGPNGCYNRCDIELFPRDVLTTQGRYRFKGLAPGREVVIDHAISIAPDEAAFLEQLASTQRVTLYRDLPQHARDSVADRYRAAVDAVAAGTQVVPGLKITLDVRPWDESTGAALTVRDENARQIGVLRLSTPIGDAGPNARKEFATKIIERVAVIVNGDAGHRNADLMPRDR